MASGVFPWCFGCVWDVGVRRSSACGQFGSRCVVARYLHLRVGIFNRIHRAAACQAHCANTKPDDRTEEIDVCLANVITHSLWRTP